MPHSAEPSPRARRRLAAGAVLALAAAWLTGPHGVPLYDGIAFPDEPYRYVQTPAGTAATKPPTIASGTVGARDGTNRGAMEIVSAEQGPQVAVSIPAHVLYGPAGAADLHLTATPTALSGAAPSHPMDGNVYRVAARADPVGLPGPVTLRGPDGAATGEISLRAVKATSQRVVFVYRPDPGAAWRELGTTKVGNDIYATSLPGLGEYALTLTGTAGGGSGPHRGAPVAVTVVLVAVLLIVVALLSIRLSRMRSAR